MGNFVSRQNAAVEEADHTNNNAYKYPPRIGNFFSTHFIMGGERFDTPQPESYLFGENADLNFLGDRPTAFPYPPPQANEPTKTLKSLVNIRKESVRFVRVPNDNKTKHKFADADAASIEQNCTRKKELSESSRNQVEGNVLCNITDTEIDTPSCCYNIEFTFDSDAKCAITVHYFCTEDVTLNGVTLTQREGFLMSFTSETYHYEKGINQCFSQPSHVFNPTLIPEDDLVYNTGREQYPVAIHCVVEEGNEECRQSHTTICVIDHHPETTTYVLRALKQKIFVDGLCYLLQEIYGIENKAVNKSPLDEEIDDHGSECVICMSETRDTLILPCRHLCLCNSCADSLRYQANNCPICRAPFRALLQIRAVQKGISTSSSHIIHHQNTSTSVTGGGESTPIDIPPGFIPVSLIEALNGPPQQVMRARSVDHDIMDDLTEVASATNNGDNVKATSPVKSSSQRSSKIKKNASTCTTTNEMSTLTTQTIGGTSMVSVVEIESDPKKSTPLTSSSKSTSTPTLNCSPNIQEVHIINERNKGLKYQKHKQIDNNDYVVDDEDSENEKLSPLLSPDSRCKNTSCKSLKQVVASLATRVDSDVVDCNSPNSDVAGEEITGQDDPSCQSDSAKRSKYAPEFAVCENASTEPARLMATKLSAEESDYYSPDDTQNNILSPLCQTKRNTSGDSESRHETDTNKHSSIGIGVGYSSTVKKIQNLHKKSTSVGNIVGPCATNSSCSGVVDLKINNVSSLPDMLDSPVSGNSASTRSSSDSYSSSSSTKQLLSSNLSTTAANIIVDDKTALQNAVNV
ncbi:hypothetical protein KR093_008698 [Drosophila rubida]|uniref:RING-type E3 ubiquitin transferase n=1 Tax=Drosophila rubida TaxID=30044 RepID=A0AAD4K9V0_9MUSC|nr:hypothetical protein KR093_008698 [Drosophila rubida]